jgi:hypothetical protein
MHGAWLGAFNFGGCGIFKMNLNHFQKINPNMVYRDLL